MPFCAFRAKPFATRSRRNRRQNHASHQSHHHQLAGQSDRHGLLPTMSSARIAELAVKHDLYVLSDEIYARIIYGGEYISMLSYPGMARAHAHHRWLLEELCHDRMAPGLRGRAAATSCPSSNAGRQQYTCVAEFTQYGAIEALRDPGRSHCRAWCSEFAGRREQFVRELNQVPGFRVPRPTALSTPGSTSRNRDCPPKKSAASCSKKRESPRFRARRSVPSGRDFVRFSFASSNVILCTKPSSESKSLVAWQSAATSGR